MDKNTEFLNFLRTARENGLTLDDINNAFEDAFEVLGKEANVDFETEDFIDVIANELDANWRTGMVQPEDVGRMAVLVAADIHEDWGKDKLIKVYDAMVDIFHFNMRLADSESPEDVVQTTIDEIDKLVKREIEKAREEKNKNRGTDRKCECCNKEKPDMSWINWLEKLGII